MALLLATKWEIKKRGIEGQDAKTFRRVRDTYQAIRWVREEKKLEEASFPRDNTGHDSRLAT
jgi:hypothetical protein